MIIIFWIVYFISVAIFIPYLIKATKIHYSLHGYNKLWLALLVISVIVFTPILNTFVLLFIVCSEILDEAKGM